jgi:hypothetical protein
MDPPTPYAPADLARGYANVAFGYHQRLPAIEARAVRAEKRADDAHALAIQANGLLAVLNSRTESIEERIEAIAQAVNARPKDRQSSSHEFGADTEVLLREQIDRATREALKAQRAQDAVATIDAIKGGSKHVFLAVMAFLAIGLTALVVGAIYSQARGVREAPTPHQLDHGAP